MSAPNPSRAAAPAVTPWWRYRMVWFVISGPAIVVVAAISTAVIAYRGADVVLVETPSARHVVTKPTSSTPALQARNHAQTPADD